MKKRQILAALLAVCCAASMAVPAFAADENPELGTVETEADKGIDDLKNWDLTVDTTVQNPTLKVTLPKSTSVLVNPYRIEVKTGSDADDTSFDTILSPVMDITNNSGCAIKVNVKGMLQTYTVVDGTPASPAETLDDTHYTITNKNNIDLTALKVVGTNIIEVDADKGNLVVGTYKAPVMNDDSTVKSKGTFNVSGYVASKNIKVATAAMKDVDAEKTNTLFIYVEGKQADGKWAPAFDAKQIAGVKDTKTGTLSTTGMMALSAKETSQSILYLESGKTGNVRVTGQAATAPTIAWMSLTDTFDTPFTFVIDAVANPAPPAPVLSKIKLANVTPNVAEASAGDAFDVKATNTGLTWDVGATNSTSTITYTTLDQTDAEKAFTSSNTAVITCDEANNKLVAKGNGKAVITFTFTSKKGSISTYTFEITVSNFS